MTSPSEDSEPKLQDNAPSERRCMDHIVAAWNEFLRLPRDHPEEVDEFRASIHRLQGIMGSRIARRDDWMGLT